MRHNRNPLEGLTKESDWIASQSESSGKLYRGILLEGATTDILWITLQRNPVGKHHDGNLLDSATMKPDRTRTGSAALSNKRVRERMVENVRETMKRNIPPWESLPTPSLLCLLLPCGRPVH